MTLPVVTAAPVESVEIEVKPPAEEVQAAEPLMITAQTEHVDQIFAEEEQQGAEAAGFFAVWGTSMLMHEMMIESAPRKEEEKVKKTEPVEKDETDE